MTRFETFTVRVSDDEKRLITSLASAMDRSRADAVRHAIRNVANQFGLRVSLDPIVDETDVHEQPAHG